MAINRSFAFAIALAISTSVATAAEPPSPPYLYDEGPMSQGPVPKFQLDGRFWDDPGQLSYSFRSFTGDMTQAEVEAAIANALALWSVACPDLAFTKLGDNLAVHDDSAAAPPQAGDLRFLFGGTNHGDGAFGANTLAHAYFPPINGVTAAGDTHFNDNFTWALNGAAGGSQPIDLQTVALHEIGHALGLLHEPAPPMGNDAVMNPVYFGPRGLSPDDIDGIRTLYCAGTVGTATPLDLVFLFDLTGSFADDLPQIQANLGSLFTAITSSFSNVRVGLASFRDFPLGSFGTMGDFAYRLDHPLTENTGTIQTLIQAFVATGGSDFPESQYEALFQVITGSGRDTNLNSSLADPEDVQPSAMGFVSGRLPVIFLLTDADFHDFDTEPGYPCSGCDAAGRTAALNVLQSAGAKVFVLIAQDPPDLTDQQRTPILGAKSVTLDDAAAELAEATGGAVLQVGTSSQLLPSAVITSLRLVQRDIQQELLEIPTLSGGMLALLALAMGLAAAVVLRIRH